MFMAITRWTMVGKGKSLMRAAFLFLLWPRFIHEFDGRYLREQP
jgi:hypothetical protein